MTTKIPPSLETLATRLDYLERLLDERFSVQQAGLKRAEVELRLWKAQQNEWRGSLNDMRANFVTMDRYESGNGALVQRYESGHSALSEVVRLFGERLNRLEGSREQGHFSLTTALQTAGVIISLMIGVIALIKTGAL
jgi:hypothetical protein